MNIASKSFAGRGIAVLASAAVLWAGFGLPASAGRPPVLTVTPSEITAGESVTVTFDGCYYSPVERPAPSSITVTYEHPTYGQTNVPLSSANDFTWTGTVTIPAGTETSEWNAVFTAHCFDSPGYEAIVHILIPDPTTTTTSTTSTTPGVTTTTVVDSTTTSGPSVGSGGTASPRPAAPATAVAAKPTYTG